MQTLNLIAKTSSQKLVKTYLEENASEALAKKINNGAVIEKNGKRLINKKTLEDFFKYAYDEARKQAAKDQNSAYIPDSVVYSWAVHYFEENGIEGTLYNEDGSKYKPDSAPKQSTPVKSAVQPKPQPKPQMSLFDFMDTMPAVEEPAVSEQTKEENIDEDDEISEEEQQEVLAELAAEEERQAREQQQNPAGSAMYRKYSGIQAKHPDCIVIYRLGDFYEVFGDNAIKIAEELDLTLTGRDYGFDERVPMVGFPYHASNNYFQKLVNSGYKLAICEALNDVHCIKKIKNDIINIDTGELITFGNDNPLKTPPEDPDDILAQEREIAKAFNPEAIQIISDLLGDSFILR